MKVCARCNIKKPSSMFQKHTNTKDRLRTECRLCCNERLRNYRKTGSTLTSRFGDTSTKKLKTYLVEITIELKKRGVDL